MQTMNATAPFEHLEVVLPTFAVHRAQNAFAALFDEDLAFVRVMLFLTRVVSPLFFWDVQPVTRQYPRPQLLKYDYRVKLYVLVAQIRPI